MNLTRKRKKLDLYYNKSYTYREIAQGLKIPPNQISDTPTAYKMLSKGKKMCM